MTGFILIALALFAGDALPGTIHLLMLVGGVVSFASPGLGRSGSQADPGASYPYPAQDDVLDGDDDPYD